MRLTKLKPLFLATAIAALVGMATEAPAAVVHNVLGGQLVGAQNVDVNGTLYDVAFQDGSCAALFDGCNEFSDFAFTTLVDALAAAQALLDQVFVDGPEGAFGTEPSTTAGCGDALNCFVYIPHDPTDAPPFSLDAAAVWNHANPAVDGIYSIGAVSPTQEFGLVDTLTWAVFTATDVDLPPSPPADVPAPGALLLLGFGLAGLGLATGKGRPAA